MVKPLHDRVLVRVDVPEEKIGSIYVPDAWKEKPLTGKILAVGTGRIVKNDIRPLDVKVGETIYMEKYAGTEVTVDGEKLLLVREDDILAIMEA